MLPDTDDGTSDVLIRREGAIVTVQLDRPQCANAYTAAMLQRIGQAVEEADADDAVRIIVVTGSGDRAFCAGADRGELALRNWKSVLQLRSSRVFGRLRKSRCVTIAAINGAAVGGGLELTLACDLRIAAEAAQFWLPEPELGLIPAAGGTELLPQIVGPGRAKELILGGAVWNAAEAFRAGLLNDVAAAGDLNDRVRRMCDVILRRDATALQLAKQAIDLSAGGQAGTGIELVAQSLLVRQQDCPEQDRTQNVAGSRHWTRAGESGS